jgi:hypothetical protein
VSPGRPQGGGRRLRSRGPRTRQEAPCPSAGVGGFRRHGAAQPPHASWISSSLPRRFFTSCPA